MKKFGLSIFILGILFIGTISLSAASDEVLRASVSVSPTSSFVSRTNIAKYGNAFISVTPLRLYSGTNKSYASVGVVNNLGIVTSKKTGYVNLSLSYSGVLSLLNVGTGQWQVTMSGKDSNGQNLASWSGDLFVYSQN